MKLQEYLLLTIVARLGFIVRMDQASLKLKITSLSTDEQWNFWTKMTRALVERERERERESQWLDVEKFAGSKPFNV